MPELRWSLLALGVVFILALLVWERRRRGASGSAAGDARAPGGRTDQPATLRSAAEPTDTADDERDVAGGSTANMPAPRRTPLREPPVVQIGAERIEGLADGPDVVSLPVVSGSVGPEIGKAAVERAAQWLAETQPSLGPDPARARRALRLDWPDDAARRIVALRVMARPGERFSGGAVRQALLGEGFEFGEFEIFHLPLEDGRVLLSAANLIKPGSFQLEKMDTERLLGLNVFAVLPGPRSPLETFDRLHAVAGALAQRLRGELRDTQGQPLSAPRLAELRREVQHGAAPRPAT